MPSRLQSRSVPSRRPSGGLSGASSGLGSAERLPSSVADQKAIIISPNNPPANVPDYSQALPPLASTVGTVVVSSISAQARHANKRRQGAPAACSPDSARERQRQRRRSRLLPAVGRYLEDPWGGDGIGETGYVVFQPGSPGKGFSFLLAAGFCVDEIRFVYVGSARDGETSRL